MLTKKKAPHPYHVGIQEDSPDYDRAMASWATSWVATVKVYIENFRAACKTEQDLEMLHRFLRWKRVLIETAQGLEYSLLGRDEVDMRRILLEGAGRMVRGTGSNFQTELEDDLVRAYLLTDYWVEGPSPFKLWIGVKSAPLAELLQKNSSKCAAFLTACNPYGEDVGSTENTELQQGLASELTTLGLSFLPGIGQDRQGIWHGEPSYLILNLELETAIKLGQQYKQNALVWCDGDTLPQLILLR